MLVERHFKNEDSIKAKIVDGHKRGVCDKDGKPLPKFAGHFVTTEEYRENYARIFGHV